MRLAGAALAACALALLVAGCRDDGADAGEGYWSGVQPVEVASGNARRGPWRQNQSDFDYVDDPTVIVSPDGQVMVAWADQASHGLRFQSYRPTGEPRFSRPVTIPSEAKTFSWMPRLAIAPGDPGRVYVLWQEIVFSGGGHGGEIFFARSQDGGATFGKPLNLSRSIGGDGKGRLTRERWDNGSFDLAVTPNGSVHAAWTEYEGRLLVSRSTDAGASFTAPAHLAGSDSRPARAPSLAADDSGGLHLAWSADGAVLVATSRDGGETWGAARTIATTGHADAPGIVADRAGTLHLVFHESEQGPFGPSRIRYARSRPGDRAFSRPRTIGLPESGTYSVAFPGIATIGAEALAIVWKRYPGRGQGSRGLGFTLSRNGGDSFTRQEVVTGSDEASLGAGGSQQGSRLRRLAANAGGHAALVDSTFAPGRASRIRLWRRP